MSVEIIRNEEDESVVDELSIDKELPNAKAISDIKSIRLRSIKNISDSRKLQEFLSNIPISTINELELSYCNMEGMDLSFLEQLQSIAIFHLEQNTGIDYNQLLRSIPNKKVLRNIYLWNGKAKST